MDKLDLLPIACTLASGELRQRLATIRELTEQALTDYQRDGLTLTHARGAAEELFAQFIPGAGIVDR
jgi:hypothetical protein